MDHTTVTYRPRKYLSVSTLLSFARCPRKYFYQKCGLTSPGVMLALSYGSAMHKAVPEALITEGVDEAFAAFMSVWEEIEEQLDKEDLLEDDRRNRRTAKNSLIHFIHTHKADKALYRLTPPPDGCLCADEKTSDYEIAWAIDIGLPIPLVGRFDGLCTHRDTGDNWVWEFKTTSRLNAGFFEAHEMNIQNLTYTLAARTLTGLSVKGMMIEGMLVSKTKVDNMTQPVLVQEHHLEANLRWLQTMGSNLLRCEDELQATMDEPDFDPAGPWLQRFDLCTAYAHFYMSGFRCGYANLCSIPDWRMLVDLYNIADEHDFMTTLPKEKVLTP